MPTAAPLNTWDGNVGFCLRAAYMGEDTCFVRGLRIRAASLVFFASFLTRFTLRLSVRVENPCF
jgi:hypothetical protein